MFWKFVFFSSFQLFPLIYLPTNFKYVIIIIFNFLSYPCFLYPVQYGLSPNCNTDLSSTISHPFLVKTDCQNPGAKRCCSFILQLTEAIVFCVCDMFLDNSSNNALLLFRRRRGKERNSSSHLTGKGIIQTTYWLVELGFYTYAFNFRNQ